MVRDLQLGDYHKGARPACWGDEACAIDARVLPRASRAERQLREVGSTARNALSAAADPPSSLPSGYLALLGQLTKVGDYDEATFKGELRARHARKGCVRPSAVWEPLDRCPPACILPPRAAQYEEMKKREGTYEVVVIEGEPPCWLPCWRCLG